ncbi:MAG: biotin transporter BioY [Paracoccaceae bacterium]|nr:MAG: biotin transporter BioY [Alphaproteobacteria bacterium]GIX12102.1 MAG: biotin transporter BioY [Paracoccaceae bacterium]
MAQTRTLHETLIPATGAAVWARHAALVAIGVAALAAASKVAVPMWPSPVPVTLGTFAVLSLGAAYGPGLGLVTILAWLGIGAMGFDVFAGTGGAVKGIDYMLGATGGYLLGFVLATVALGAAARAGWDRNVWKMALAMLIGNALIYVPGLLWLHQLIAGGMFDPAKYESAWSQTLAWGLTPYLVGDALKLALAALLFPALWALVRRVRG